MKVRTVEMDSEDTFSRIKPSDYRENWPPYTLELENVYIGPGGAIYNTNGLLNPLACFTYGFWGNLNQDSDRPNNSLEAQAWAKKQPAINPRNFTIDTLDVGRNYVYAHHYFNIYVFGHLWDTLQDLGKIEGLNLQHKTLITPSVTGHVNDLDIHLQAFGFPLEKRVSLDLPAHKPCNLFI